MNGKSPWRSPSSRCRNVNHRESRFTGYRVNHVYNGRSHETIMQNDPGTEMRMRVSVVPG